MAQYPLSPKCVRVGAHRAHNMLLEDMYGDNYTEFCGGLRSEFEKATERRKAEIREAKAQAKHERKLARIQKRRKFGFVL